MSAMYAGQLPLCAAYIRRQFIRNSFADGEPVQLLQCARNVVARSELVCLAFDVITLYCITVTLLEFLTLTVPQLDNLGELQKTSPCVQKILS